MFDSILIVLMQYPYFRKTRLLVLNWWVKFWSNYWERRLSECSPKNISIKVIDHRLQRYNTTGDYYYTMFGTLIVTISNLGNSRYHHLILIHELIEAKLCGIDGVTMEQIDAFDFAAISNDPGCDTTAPYHKQHMYAEGVEQQLCERLELDWELYDQVNEVVMDKYVHFWS